MCKDKTSKDIFFNFTCKARSLILMKLNICKHFKNFDSSFFPDTLIEIKVTMGIITAVDFVGLLTHNLDE